MNIKCMNCGNEFNTSELSCDSMGCYTNCDKCDSSFDVEDPMTSSYVDINSAIEDVTRLAMESIKATDLKNYMDVCNSNLQYNISERFSVFMDFSTGEELEEVWLWLSLEDDAQDDYSTNIDEQDTTDLNKENIENAITILLERNKEKIWG